MESGSVLVIEKGEWENGAYLSLRRGMESGSLLVIEKRYGKWKCTCH